MKSPFPDMDPWLERNWLDVHTKLVTYSTDGLNEQLSSDLIASSEERVAVEEDIAPYRLLAQVEPIIERYIKIIAAGTERVVTVIEFVSPTNKRWTGLRAFMGKRAELIASGINFVEIDLVRRGNWETLLRPHQCTEKTESLYRVTIRLPEDPGAVFIHPIRLPDRLPEVVIPLREKDPELRLDLQPLLDRTYANGRYYRRIDYSKPCMPPLDGEDAEWAQNILKAAGRI